MQPKYCLNKPCPHSWPTDCKQIKWLWFQATKFWGSLWHSNWDVGDGRSKETSEEDTAEIQEREKGNSAYGRNGGGESENGTKRKLHTHHRHHRWEKLRGLETLHAPWRWHWFPLWSYLLQWRTGCPRVDFAVGRLTAIRISTTEDTLQTARK